MRNVQYLVVHCTAGPKDQSTKVIQDYWKNSLKWKSPGYHILVNANGSIDRLAPDDAVTNGVAGYNSKCLHVCYKGGQKTDDRTAAQKQTIRDVLKSWKAKYPNAIIQGHRDFPNVSKACPRFNAKDEYSDI